MANKISFKSLLKRIFVPKIEKRNFFVSIGLLFLSFMLIFPTGACYSGTKADVSANYFASTIKKFTDKETIPLIVEQKDDDHKLANTFDEYVHVYGAFGVKKTSYFGTVNADKAQTITLPDVLDCPNLSVLYIESGIQSNEYEGHYRHEFYPIEFMFKSVYRKQGDFSVVYISQTQADAIIKHNNLNENDYQSLMSQTITMRFDGEDYNWTIGNIYLETNYFYDALNESIGDFVVCYNTFPPGFQKQATYLMNEYAFQNKTFIDRAKTMYPYDNYNYKISTYNIDETMLDLDYCFMFLDKGNTKAITDFMFTILLILTIFSFIASLIYIKTSHFSEHLNSWLYLFISMLLPWSVFATIFAFCSNAFIFSSFSRIATLIGCIIAPIACLIYFLISKVKNNVQKD